MSKHKHVSETPATLLLKRRKIAFGEHPYDYINQGGALEAARQLGIDPHSVAKTLIMQDEQARPLIILMHGDCDVSTKALARQAGVKKIEPCSPALAQKHSGYLVGGTSPFATRKKMPVWVQAALLEQAVVYVNGGRRGYLISVSPDALTALLGALPVQVSLTKA